ncbi:sodium/potassium-transporting ATPase subunit beta-like [Ruditapes philippinarum]|uniref:sodium/potassium-transporting ATPase subunit beta-like n=1 Tax=Ruditapes philippinarum TaxID=129788 RepID=UPI00295B6D1D|nr:sodium/potassium-transporting ATPase subunit beta-like [Ruditapes philippinarum]
MSYDRVDYSDKAHFSSPSDEHHYSDDPVRNGTRNGNGIYNDYTVELKPKPYRNSIKVLCCECKNTKRVKFIMAGAVVVFLLALILIIISAIAHHKQQQANKGSPAYGLFAYGPDKNGLISFSPRDHMTYMNYFNRLESSLADYSTLRQSANLDRYIHCDDNTTKVPHGKVCMLTMEKFGDNCQHFDMYGINEERPCVLLVLKPDDNITPQPFDFTDGKNADIKEKIGDRFSSKSVAVSCEGKTAKDQALMMRDNYTAMVDYNPPKGFPLFYFLEREADGYLYPAVMVQFNTVPPNTQVNIVCTAWAKNFNNGQPQSSQKYSTEFAILLK